ncbi:hypothetical protein B0T11DRAFT_340405 [Plectosphaerella cucumerina]|uniref:Uncharacterized protein n=1 Tax=Plectosphaerella cucumerina TaxID=40658 RepID=A0A8K0X236_9PEZI|nr:hypothetical protein B0T11DRAFT_340405 [Plectosphaerella cucumerina]
MNVPESNEQPPPPYSETDIYSNAGSGSRSSEGRTPATSQANPSVAGESTASRSRPPTSIGSSQSDVVYTPPLTPRTVNTHDGFLPPSSSAAAAEAYFESRPASSNDSPGLILHHTVTISPASRPDDFPFPQGWARWDVTRTDWQTFLNFLLPAHIAASNEEVLDRKLRAEEESLSPGTTAGPPSFSGRSHVSAQLEHLRISHGETATHSAEARREAGLVVSEWNHGFFLPRRLTVDLSFEAPIQAQENQRPAMPGAWNSGSDHNTPQHRHQGPYQPPPHPPPPLVGPPQMPPWVGPGYHQQPRSGFSFAGIRMNDDGLYIGNSLSADRNGFRLGGLVADTNGLRYRDNVVVGPGMFSGGANPEYPGMQHQSIPHPPQPYTGPQPSLGSGGVLPAQNPYQGPPNLNRGVSGSLSYSHQGPPRHSRSASSVSSKSSSTSSTSSLGSLPDYDELDGAQIPLYRSTLQSWLVTPEKQVTKQDVQRLRAELREARRREAEYPPGNVDKQALKAEIKALKQEWRALRRTQRSAKFKQLDEMEKELARKMDRIFETARDVKDKGSKGGSEERKGEKPSDEGSGPSKEVLEREVDELMKRVERLRMEADETFARELEEEDRRQAMPR